jgi:hypothetical protein
MPRALNEWKDHHGKTIAVAHKNVAHDQKKKP